MSPEELRQRIAENIKALAAKRGFSIPMLADRAGVNRAHAYNVLDATAAATTDWLAKIADALAVDPSMLLSNRISTD